MQHISPNKTTLKELFATKFRGGSRLQSQRFTVFSFVMTAGCAVFFVIQQGEKAKLTFSPRDKLILKSVVKPIVLATCVSYFESSFLFLAALFKYSRTAFSSTFHQRLEVSCFTAAIATKATVTAPARMTRITMTMTRVEPETS